MNVFEWLGIILLIGALNNPDPWYFSIPIIIFAAILTLYLGEEKQK